MMNLVPMGVWRVLGPIIALRAFAQRVGVWC